MRAVANAHNLGHKGGNQLFIWLFINIESKEQWSDSNPDWFGLIGVWHHFFFPADLPLLQTGVNIREKKRQKSLMWNDCSNFGKKKKKRSCMTPPAESLSTLLFHLLYWSTSTFYCCVHIKTWKSIWNSGSYYKRSGVYYLGEEMKYSIIFIAMSLLPYNHLKLSIILFQSANREQAFYIYLQI